MAEHGELISSLHEIANFKRLPDGREFQRQTPAWESAKAAWATLSGSTATLRDGSTVEVHSCHGGLADGPVLVLLIGQACVALPIEEP